MGSTTNQGYSIRTDQQPEAGTTHSNQQVRRDKADNAQVERKLAAQLVHETEGKTGGDAQQRHQRQIIAGIKAFIHQFCCNRGEAHENNDAVHHEQNREKDKRVHSRIHLLFRSLKLLLNANFWHLEVEENSDWQGERVDPERCDPAHVHEHARLLMIRQSENCS